MRISDWSSDVCSSDLSAFYGTGGFVAAYLLTSGIVPHMLGALLVGVIVAALAGLVIGYLTLRRTGIYFAMSTLAFGEMFYFLENSRSEEHTSELQLLMRTSYAVFCLKTKQNHTSSAKYVRP